MPSEMTLGSKTVSGAQNICDLFCKHFHSVYNTGGSYSNSSYLQPVTNLSTFTYSHKHYALGHLFFRRGSKVTSCD